MMGDTITDREARTTPIEKDPTADVTLAFDWADYLADGETIATVTFAVDEVSPADEAANITVDADTPDIVGTVTTCWLRPGSTEGTTYRVRATVTTSAARDDTRSAHIRLRDL